jgi:hypothetical protein
MKCYAGTQTLMDSLNDICKGKWTWHFIHEM